MIQLSFVRGAVGGCAAALNSLTPLPEVPFGTPIATRLKVLSMLLWTACVICCPLTIADEFRTIVLVGLGVFMVAVTGYAKFYIARTLKRVSFPLSYALIVGPAGLIAAWLVSHMFGAAAIIVVAVTCSVMISHMRRAIEADGVRHVLLSLVRS